MKRIKFKESQIINILKEYESGREVKDLCREYGISRATFYNWKKKYSGMDASQLKRLKELEEENQRLKRMYADLSLDHEMLKDVLGKKF
jgi:putative transposase